MGVLTRKRNWALVILVIILAFQGVLQTHANPTWNVQVVDPAGTGGSIAFDSDDNPHISYYVDPFFDENRSGLNYAVWTGTNWSLQTVDTSGDSGFLRLDSQDKPRILYASRAGTELKYAACSGGNWTFQNIGISERAIDYAMVLDSSGNPHIVYSDFDYYRNYYNYNYTDTRDLLYAVYNGSSWAVQNIDTVRGRSVQPSIALDSNNYPHIIYLEEVESKFPSKNYPYVSIYSTFNIKYATCTGSSWRIQTVASNSSSTIGSIGNIALDSNDHPHLSYIHEDFVYNSDAESFMVKRSLNHAYWDGSTWNVQIVDSKPYAISYGQIYLSLDSSDKPQIYFCKGEYFENITDSGLMHAKLTGSTWNIETVDSNFVIEGSIMLDSHGNLHTLSSEGVGTIHGVWQYGNLTYATLESTPILTPTSMLITTMAVTAVGIVIGLLIYLKKRKH